MKATDLTHESQSALQEPVPQVEQRQARKQLAGMGFEDQLAAVKPAADGQLKQSGYFDGIDAFDAVVAGKSLLRYGCTDQQAVQALQKALNAMGHAAGEVDGIWGSKTQHALLSFQLAQGLSADGVIGPNTMSALSKASGGIPVDKGVPEKPVETDKPEVETGEPPDQKIDLVDKPTEDKPAENKPTEDKPAENKGEHKVAGDRIGTIFQKLQDPTLAAPDLLALQNELTVALGVPEFSQAQGMVQMTAAEGPELDARTQTLQFFQALLAYYNIHRPTLQIPEKEAVAIQLRLEHLTSFYGDLVNGGYDQAVSPQRAALVSTALAQIGRSESKSPGGEAKYGKTRYGWEFLDQVFAASYGGKAGELDENDDYTEHAVPKGEKQSGYGRNLQLTVKYHTFNGQNLAEDLQHWCGHFTMWALKSNGISAGNWPNVDMTSIATNHKAESDFTPQPGDVAYSQSHNQHYCIVVKVEGDTIHTIDGNTNGGVNSTTGGKILPVARNRHWFSNFYALNG